MAQSSVGSNSLDINNTEPEVDSKAPSIPFALISTIERPKLLPQITKKDSRLTARQYRQEFARRTARMRVKRPTRNYFWCEHCRDIHYHSQ